MNARVAGAFGSLAVHAAIVLIVVAMVQTDKAEPDKPESISVNLNIFKSVASAPNRQTPEPVTLPKPQQPTTVKHETRPAPQSQVKAPEPDSKPADVIEQSPITSERSSVSATPVTKTITATTPLKNKASLPDTKEQPATDIAPPAIEEETVLEFEQITTVNTSSNASAPTIQSVDTSTADIEIAEYTEQVRSAVLAQRNYPQRARRKKMTGTVIVTFRVFASGELDFTRVTESSGHDLLDRAAMGAVKRAGRFSRFPDDIKKQYWDFRVPIVFQ